MSVYLMANNTEITLCEREYFCEKLKVAAHLTVTWQKSDEFTA